MPLIKDHKKRGEWVEVQFLARAASQGFTVAKPWGDSARFDFILEFDHRCLRVQVKSAVYRRRDGAGYTVLTHSRGPHAPRRSYTPKEVDFIAAYLIPDDIWYIIPVADLKGQTNICLNPYLRRSRHARYLEAWHLLKQPVPGAL